jgi:hypothetical protein
MVRASLLEPGCHEAQMIPQTFHFIGADTAQPGTASRARNRYRGSAVGLVCRPGVFMNGVGTQPQGGRAP